MGVLSNKYLSGSGILIENTPTWRVVTIQCQGKHSYPWKNRQHSTGIKMSFKNVSYFACWIEIIPTSQNKINKFFSSLESFIAEYLHPSTEDYACFRYFYKWLFRCGKILKCFIKPTQKLKKIFCIALLSLCSIHK